MLFNRYNLKKFLGRDPAEWFKDRGFTYTTHAIGFDLKRGDKAERFDYPFHSAAIEAVLIKFDLDELDAILERTNPPMGSSTGRAIAASLRRLDVEEARSFTVTMVTSSTSILSFNGGCSTTSAAAPTEWWDARLSTARFSNPSIPATN